MPIVYLHGMPGGPGELYLFDGVTKNAFFAPDRNAVDDGRIDAMVAAIGDRFPGERVRLVAFSLGARSALELAVQLGNLVSGIDLIAPAASMTAADRTMAGYPVFIAARRFPVFFGALVRLQATAARLAPSRLYAALFRTAQGADRMLLHDSAFRSTLVNVLQRCFADGGRAYRAEVSAYVVPWSELSGRVFQPVTLWHGTLDNWAPIAMSERLSAQLPHVVASHCLEGLSHYSTLATALRAIAPAVSAKVER